MTKSDDNKTHKFQNTEKIPTVILQIPQHYIKVPKEIIIDSAIPEHRISVLQYLNYNQTWDKTVHYSPIHMIQWCGYKPNWHRGNVANIYTKFRDSMQWMFENKYILNFEKDKYTQNTFQSSLLNKGKLYPTSNFGLLYDFEINTIMQYEPAYRPLNKSILLLVLAYIRAFTWLRASHTTGHSENSKKSKPEIFHSQFKIMGEYIGVKEKLISKAVTVLEKMEIIKTHRMPSYHDKDGQWHTDDIIFICPYKIIATKTTLRVCTKEEYYWERELEYAILYLRNTNHISKKFYQGDPPK